MSAEGNGGFRDGDRVRAPGNRTGIVIDASYVYHGVLVKWDEPESVTRLMAPFLPFELEKIDTPAGAS